MTTVEALAEVARKHGVAVGAATLTMGAGFLAGYYFAKHRLETQINEAAEERIAEEIAASRKFVVSDDKPRSPEDAIEKLIPEAADALGKYVSRDAEAAMRLYQGRHEESPEEAKPADTADMVGEDGELVVQRSRSYHLISAKPGQIPPQRRNNVWKDDAEVMVPEVDFDYQAEIDARTDNAPYIISKEEYLENVSDNEQLKWTFFAGDQILVGEDDEVILEPNSWVGLQNLRFGHRSGDDRIVYIRNPVNRTDFQIALSDGTYAHEVAGFDPNDQR